MKVGKNQLLLCYACISDWLDSRDKAVEAAFKKWAGDCIKEK